MVKFIIYIHRVHFAENLIENVLYRYRSDNPDDLRVKEIPGSIQTEGIGRKVGVLIGLLHPGVEYIFEITTEAHSLRSETIRKTIRTQPLITSELTVINKQEVTNAMTIRYTPTPLSRSLFDTYRYVRVADFHLRKRGALFRF